MQGIGEYRIKKIKRMDKFEVQAIGEKILDYVEKSKYSLIFKSKKQICDELNLSHYKLKFYLEVYKKYIKDYKDIDLHLRPTFGEKND
ncbi:MAG: hypothetical protein EKK57_02255 [Proteobacteria bacterium]|nr:MAG: hypothetical protein EKK57_02255 [Pseudomonadota bacterium]